MKRLVIAIDCDDVLTPSVPSIVSWYNETHGTSAKDDDFYNEDPKIWDAVDAEEKYTRIRAFLRSERFAQEAKPFEDAISIVHELAKLHELHLVTGRSQSVDIATHAMLDAYFKDVFVSVEHVGPMKQPDGTYFKRSKGEVCKLINADVLIDDNIHHAKNVLDTGTPHVIVFGDYGWNRNEPLPGGHRCHTWSDVRNLITELAG